MEVLIVCLLVLILIALISSNARSAAAVKKTLGYALFAALAISLWALWIAALITLVQTLVPEQGEHWAIWLCTLTYALWPIYFVWRERKLIQRSIQSNKLKAAYKASKLIAAAFIGLLLVYIGSLVYKEGVGFLALSTMLAASGGILFAYSCRAGAVVYEVWFERLPQWEFESAITDERDRLIEIERQERFPTAVERLANTQPTNEDAYEVLRTSRLEGIWNRWKEADSKIELKYQHEESSIVAFMRSVFWISAWGIFIAFCASNWTVAETLLKDFKVFREHEWAVNTFLILVCLLSAALLNQLIEVLKKRLASLAVKDFLMEMNLKTDLDHPRADQHTEL